METFFATEAEADLADDLKHYAFKYGADSLGARYVRESISLIGKSVKFRVPDNGYILPGLRESEKEFGQLIEDYIPEFRLPYPQTLIEYRFDVTARNYENENVPDEIAETEYTGVVLLAFETGESQASLIPLWRVWIEGRQKWVMANFRGLIDAENKELSIEPITEMGERYGANSAAAINDLRGEISALLEFLAALSCSNSAAENVNHGRERLNKKRQKSGKPPFYSYKVLTITQHTSAGGGGGKSGRSPRVHLRRGHIRRLPNKTVWVNAAVVGDKSKGFVAKDYAVAAQA